MTAFALGVAIWTSKSSVPRKKIPSI
jgi:hypothetical protein